jgi:single-strand DNA-binding protein
MGVNKTLLVGRLGKNPELIENEDNVMARFTLATNENYQDADKNIKEKVEWHNVVAFGKRARACEKYLKKGAQVYIEGRNATRSYKKDGQTHYITEVQIKDIQFLDTKD